MIVDDDFIVRRGMCEAIDWAKLDAQVVGEANDGEEALARIALAEPDVIFCDVVMPRMNGIALLSQVRISWPWIKMVMVSAHDEAAYVRQALQGDAVDYLLKPFHEEDIARVLTTVRDKLSKERIMLSEQTRENPQQLFAAKEHIQAAGQALRALEREAALLEARGLFYAIRAGGIQSRLLITTLSVELIVDAMHVLQEAGAAEAAARMADTLGNLTRQADLDALEASVLRAVEGCMDTLDALASPDARLAAQACRIIEQQYTQNLTVNEIADRLHVSANTLQKIFKIQVGHTVRQHLINVRIDAAKALLRGTRERVYNIGAAVGYQDADFFSRTFVKATGKTPQQYRDEPS